MDPGIADDFRQLLPCPAHVNIEGLLEGLQLRGRAPAERPYTVVNFIASADGRVSFRGRSGPLGDDGDRRVFHALRESSDAVLAGLGTMRSERYGRLLGREERRARRLARGLPAEPVACIITRSGALPAEIPLLDCAEARVVVLSPREPPGLAGRAAQTSLHVLPAEELTLSAALRLLRREHEVRLLLCEGGPTVFGALLAERLVDELFLTLAPKLAGGGAGMPLALGPEPDRLTDLRIHWLLERAGSLFLRYGLAQPADD
jgi:riboflavin biosynthesis pyrimidine reductase